MTIPTKTVQVAYLGMGVMGSAMAANLAKAGFPITVWNRTPNRPGEAIAIQAGAISAQTIATCVAEADFIFTCLGDIADVQAVIFGEEGVAASARPGALIIDTSTIGPDAVRAIAISLELLGLRFLDAPVSGGDTGAQNGTLTFMVGGQDTDFAECLPYFKVMGKNIYHCGAVGSGQAVKLCNQILCAIHAVGFCEALQLAKLHGLDPNLMIQVCSTGAAGSWALSNLAPKAVQSDFSPGFMIKHMLKDLRLVQEGADAANLDLPGTQLADQLFKIVQTLDGGTGGQQGTQAMLRAYKTSA